MMGLFTTFKESVQKFFGTGTSARIADLANKALTIITSPIASVVNFQKAQTATAQKGALRLVGEGVINTLAVVAPLTTAGRTAIVTGASSLIPKSIAGKVIGGAGLLVAGGAVATSQKARETAVEIVPRLISAGQDIGQFVDKPSLENGISYLRSHPYLTALTAGGALASLGYSGILVANILSNYFGRKATRENTEAIIAGGIPISSSGGLVSSSGNVITPTTEVLPVLPETERITTGTRKRRHKQQQQQYNRISQRVNVIVSNRSVGTQSKTYLNREVMLN